MVIGVTVKLDKEFLNVIRDKALNGPQRVFVKFGNIVASVGDAAVNRLSTEPGRPRYPIRWTSERQRKFVMAKLRRDNNLPYQRTGGYAANWQWRADNTPEGGIFTIFNPTTTESGVLLEQFVQGDRQQGFHSDTGWIPSEDVVTTAIVDAELMLIDLWDEEML